MTKAKENKRPTQNDPVKAKSGLGHRDWYLGATYHDVITTEFEWATIRFQQAFERYCIQIAHVSGLGELSYPEIILLHVIGLQDGPITASMLARQINADTVTNIQYSLRKLDTYRLIVKNREAKGNIQTYDLTPKGKELIKKYAYFRQKVLTDQTKVIEAIDRKLVETTKLISMLTGMYDEAMRVSATYDPGVADDGLGVE